jgi:hypothetical protein
MESFVCSIYVLLRFRSRELCAMCRGIGSLFWNSLSGRNFIDYVRTINRLEHGVKPSIR